MRTKNNKYIPIAFAVLLGAGFSAYEILHANRAQNIPKANSALALNAAKDTDTADAVGTDLLGKAEISFAGGTKERNDNITLGISHINGTLVQPGEEFSFTKTLGPVTEEGGYSEAKVFLNGEVVKGIGGGLCQVSTTLFRSALSAGLHVTERHNHSYTVSYYDVGLDATYSDPGPDLKFVNDTTHPIVIKGRTEDQKAIFEIYGTSDGRIASTTDAQVTDIIDVPPPKYVATTTPLKTHPDCINAPQIGYTATVVYGVLSADGVEKQQSFVSNYKPLQRVCYIPMSTASSSVVINQ